MTVGSAYEGANVDGPQELLNIARHHCQAIQTIIDQLTEIKSNTELRLLSQRLQCSLSRSAEQSRWLMQKSPSFSLPEFQVVLKGGDV
jgi:hypothetical protein